MIAADAPYIPCQPGTCCNQKPLTDFYFIDVGAERVCWTVLCQNCGRKVQAEWWDQAIELWNKVER